MRHFASALITFVVAVPLLLAQSPRDTSLPPSPSTVAGVAAKDWSSIRSAHQAFRHAAVAVDGGYEARNPGQCWTARFDGRGLSTRPDGDGWSWGLDLERYGFASAQHSVTRPTKVAADGSRVAYAWNDDLEEWYVNDPRGLEHGFTLRARPGCDAANSSAFAAGELTLTLDVRGGLAPVVAPDGLSVAFTDRDGRDVLRYSDLAVVDADRRPLSAHMTSAGSKIVLAIDEHDARYPLTIDPIVQQAYLKASNTNPSDNFGCAVAISGDTAVVGAFGEASAGKGPSANPADNSAPQAGAAYVFVRNGSAWTQQAYLKASNTDAGDFFGWAVAISGDTIAIGARYEGGAGKGPGANQNDNNAPQAGAVYIFVRNGTTWTQQAYLKASNTDAKDTFGWAVAIDGDTLCVGAQEEGSAYVGNETDNSATCAGAAYIFVRNGTTWSQQAYLKASNVDAFDEFGFTAAIFGDTCIIGANYESSSGSGPNADPSDNNAPLAGAAYVFVRSGTTWTQQAYLKASNSDANDEFGDAVAISGDTAIVGARWERSTGTGVTADPNDDGAPSAGAAYVFVRNAGVWTEQAYLKASNTETQDGFGWSVAIAGDTCAVGARYEDSAGTGLTANPADNTAQNAGAVYLFQRSGTTWSPKAYLKASNTGAGDAFGVAVAMDGSTLIVGALGEDSSGTGTSANPADNLAQSAGAAYAFELSAWQDLGSGKAGVAGVPKLEGTGTLEAGSAGSLVLTKVAANAPAILLISLSSTPAPAYCGSVVPVPAIALLSFVTPPAGGIPLAWASWTPGLSGQSLYFQWLIADNAAPCTVAMSNAIRGDVP